MSYRKPKYIMLRMSLVFILVGIFLWSYILFWQNINRISLSERMIEAILENKIELARKYAKELGLVQVNLERTQAFLRDVRAENLRLKEKVKLLDQLSDLDKEINSLREENAKIHEAMLSAKKDVRTVKVKENFNFNSVEEGRSLLKQLKDKIEGIKQRIGFLRKKDHENKVAIQQEIDQKKMLLGNNGYIVKDGRPLPMTMPDSQCSDVRIKVEFVK